MNWLWNSSDARKSERAVESCMPSPDYDVFSLCARLESTATPVEQPDIDRPVKRRRSDAAGASFHHGAADGSSPPPAKRVRPDGATMLSPHSTVAGDLDGSNDVIMAEPDLERAKETIQFQFGLEILLKHNELRLINQELAKCQVSLEQLRRCHLIPYPLSCPTPEQMLQISSGTGAAIQTQPGQAVPQWAPPFGVVDGPYARHYAKWLIPDEKFDGIQSEAQAASSVAARSKVSNVDRGRMTRKSIAEGNPAPPKTRPARGAADKKSQALSSGEAQVKEKQLHAPCTLRRSDGQLVQLICTDCLRWDFSSTQGFINHCRIQHHRNYGSHGEAAMHAGKPIELDEKGAIIGMDKPGPVGTSTATSVPSAAPVSGLVHPFASHGPITDRQAYISLQARISASVELFKAGQLPNVKFIPGSEPVRHGTQPDEDSFKGASSTPYLSRLLQKRNFSGDLSEQIADAKTRMDLDEEDEEEEGAFTPGEDGPSNITPSTARPVPSQVTRNQAPVVMRIPARMAMTPVPLPNMPIMSRQSSSKNQALNSSFKPATTPAVAVRDDENSDVYDDDDNDEPDVELSPNTIASHTAPSLVSDDGEYDDSDDGSSSETSEVTDSESVSDVAEINVDEDNDNEEAPRSIRHRCNQSATTVKLKKDEAKHAGFITPIAGTPPSKVKGRPRKKTS